MECPRCHQEEHVKNGFMCGKQRYKCKSCGCNFTQSVKQGYPLQIKKKALRYYLEGMGFRRIERLLCVSHVSVMNWVKQASNEIRKEREQRCKERNIDILELDELCTYIKKTNINIGSGSGLREIPKKYWDIILALVD